MVPGGPGCRVQVAGRRAPFLLGNHCLRLIRPARGLVWQPGSDSLAVAFYSRGSLYSLNVRFPKGWVEKGALWCFPSNIGRQLVGLFLPVLAGPGFQIQGLARLHLEIGNFYVSEVGVAALLLVLIGLEPEQDFGVPVP